jgi:putative molybdopterin biosynthesis protein
VAQTVQTILSALSADVVAGRLAPGDPMPSVRAVADRFGCSPGTAARAHTRLREAGVISGTARSRAVVSPDGASRAIAIGAGVGTVRLSGSDDPALDLLLSAAGPGVHRTLDGRGSVAGLTKLAEGAVDASAVHLADPRTGRSNDAFVSHLFAGGPALLVHLWRREQGIVVPKGNPRGIRGIEQLAGAKLAWRGPGTGSRLLLSRLLTQARVTPRPDFEPCDSHLGVAVAVAAGAADAGLAVRAAAEGVGAEFLPVMWEDFELALAPESLTDLAPVLAVLASTSVQDRLSTRRGYDVRRSGETRMAAA